MTAPFITGIQQIGIGVTSREDAWRWYRRAFGMDVPVFTEEGEAALMTRYTGGRVHARTATLALNLSGGGGFEIWQFTDRDPAPPLQPVGLGSTGILAPRIKALDVSLARRHLTSLSATAGERAEIAEPRPDPSGNPGFFSRDPFGNLFHVVEAGEYFARQASPTGGVSGALIGVSDMQRSLVLYRDLLGFDETVYDVTGRFPDFAGLPAGDGAFRRVRLTRSAPSGGPFSRLYGETSLELVSLAGAKKAPVFQDRYWGDQGFIHLCFDVVHMNEWEARLASGGFPFTVNSAGEFTMESAGGHFAYIEDPDGALIELVETMSVPIIRKLGWKIDLTRRQRDRPLPNWMIRLLGLTRVKT